MRDESTEHGWGLVLLLAGTLFGFAPSGALKAEPVAGEGAQYIVVHTSSRSISRSEQVGDVLVIEGRLEIAGVVRGHLFSLNGDIIVRSTAVVLGSITVQGGRLKVEDGAVLPASIMLRDAKLFGQRGEIHAQSGRAVGVGRLGTRVDFDPAKLSTTEVSLMKSVLPFERFVPRTDTPLEAWNPGLGLELKKEDWRPSAVLVGGLIRLNFVSERVRGAFQRGYRGSRGTVLFTGIALQNETDATALFDQIAQSAPSLALSVKSALGGGAHWFFIRNGRAVMLWRTGEWFFSVETKLAAEGATPAEQKQFSEQVLTNLRANLQALEAAAARGDISKE